MSGKRKPSIPTEYRSLYMDLAGMGYTVAEREKMVRDQMARDQQARERAKPLNIIERYMIEQHAKAERERRQAY